MSETILRQNVIVQYQADTDEFSRKSQRAAKDVDGIGASLKRIGKVTLAGVAIAEVTQNLIKASAAAEEFEFALSQLSSITGATGKDLEFYKEQAAEIGRTTTLSATQAVEAFKLIGSLKPELLTQKELLADVAKNAVVLAEAANLELGPAALALSGTLNQFGLSGSEAGRVINVLAAGSKVGAADILLINESMTKFGSVANQVNITVEESVGLIETLAEKQLVGAEAGTALRNVLLRIAGADALPKEAIKTLEEFGVSLEVITDKSLPLETRLREISKIGNDTTATMKVFGIENQVAAAQILRNVDVFAKYTEGVTGTQVAIEQAEINTNNLRSAKHELANAVEAANIKFGEFLNKGILPMVRFITQLVISLTNLPKFIYDNRVAILSLTAGLILFNGQAVAAAANSLRLAAAKKAAALGANALTLATNILSAAMKANPLGIALRVIGLLVAAFGVLYSRVEAVRNVVAGFVNVFKEGFASFGRGGFDAAQSFSDGFAANKAAEAKMREQGRRSARAFNFGLAEGLAEAANPFVLAPKPATGEQAPTDPTIPTSSIEAQRGSIEALQKRIEELTDRYQKLNTGTERGRILAGKYVEQIRGLAVEVNRLKKEFEDALRRDFDPLPVLENRGIAELKRRIETLNEEIIAALKDGNTELADSLIVQREVLNEQIILLAEVFANPDLVTDQIEAYNKAIVNAIRRGNDEQAQALIDQQNRLKREVEALKIIAGDPEAEKQFVDLGVKAAESRKKALDSVIQRTKEATQKGFSEQREADQNQRKQQDEDQKESLRQSLESVAAETTGLLQSIAEARSRAYEETIAFQEERVERFRELAETGSAEQLKIEQERLDKLTAERQKAAERERIIAQGEVVTSQAVTVAKTAEAIAKAFSQGGPFGIITGILMSTALLATLGSAVAQAGSLFSSLPAFAEGTEYVEGRGTRRSDSILSRLSVGERVVDADTNARLYGIRNESLPQAVNEWRSTPAVVSAINSQTVAQERQMSALIEETRWMRRELNGLRASNSRGMAEEYRAISREMIRTQRMAK